jgi:hypothetical protein
MCESVTVGLVHKLLEILLSMRGLIDPLLYVIKCFSKFFIFFFFNFF